MLHAATYKCLFVQLFVYFMKLRLYPFGTSGDVPLTSPNACLHSNQRGITASPQSQAYLRTYMDETGVVSYLLAHKHSDTHT